MRASRRWPSSPTWSATRSATTPRSATSRSTGCSSTPRRRSSRRSRPASATTRPASWRRGSRHPDPDDARGSRAARGGALDGGTLLTSTVVWTAGVRANALAADLGLPLDEQGRIRVDPTLRVEGVEHLGARGLRARSRTRRRPISPTRPRPSTRCGRRGDSRGTSARGTHRLPLPHARPGGHARPLQGDRRRHGPPPARLPRLVRHADVPPVPAPLFSRKLRVVVDWTVALFFRRDIAELGQLGHPSHPGETAGGGSAPPTTSETSSGRARSRASLRERAADRTAPFALGLEHVTPRSRPCGPELPRIDRAEGLEATDLAEFADRLRDAGRHRLSVPSEEEGRACRSRARLGRDALPRHGAPRRPAGPGCRCAGRAGRRRPAPGLRR